MDNIGSYSRAHDYSRDALYANATLANTDILSKSTWSLFDVVVLSMLACAIFAIVTIPIVPIAPSIFLPYIALFLLMKNGGVARLKDLFNLLEVKIFAFISVYQVIGLIVSRGDSYANISLCVRTLSSFIFVLSMALYISTSPQALKRCWTVIFICCTASALWYIGEYYIEEPFISWRNSLYDEIYTNLPDDKVIYVRSGLAPFPHLVGYQLAFMVPVLFSWSTAKLSGLLIRVGAAITTSLALVLSSERSSLVASISVITLILLYTRGAKLVYKLVFISLLLIMSSLVMSVLNPTDVLNGQLSLLEKLQQFEYWEEATFRIELQWIAVALLFEYPLGLKYAGVNWIDEGFWPAFMRHPQLVLTDTMAVHNGYLGYPLELGLVLFLASLLLLWLVFKRVLSALSIYKAQHFSILYLGLIAGSTSVLIIHSMTHNGSILSQEPISLFSLAVIYSCEVLRRNGKLQHYI